MTLAWDRGMKKAVRHRTEPRRDRSAAGGDASFVFDRKSFFSSGNFTRQLLDHFPPVRFRRSRSLPSAPGCSRPRRVQVMRVERLVAHESVGPIFPRTASWRVEMFRGPDHIANAHWTSGRRHGVSLRSSNMNCQFLIPGGNIWASGRSTSPITL